MSNIDRLSMVYDADGGLVGEARYVIGHLLGRASCDLCDITHGGVRRKQSFSALVDEVEAGGVAIDVVHRNEQHPELAAFTEGRHACVVAHRGDEMRIIASRKELNAMNGRVAALREHLLSHLDADG